MSLFNCPICDGKSYIVIGNPSANRVASEIIKEDYKVVQCRDCSGYSVFPEIGFSIDEWKRLYNSEYFASQTPWLMRKRREDLIERFNRLQSYARNPVRRFLDIGCGEGNTFEFAANLGWEVWANDIVDHRKQEAVSLCSNFSLGSLLELNYPDNHFDCIYLDSVLEHVINPAEYLKEINRILTKGGIVYIGVPNEDSLFNSIKKFLFALMGKGEISSKIKPFDSPYHVIGFNRKSIKTIMDRSGHEILNFRNFGRKFEFLGFTPEMRGFWISLTLLPVEWISYLIKRDVYFDMIIKK